MIESIIKFEKIDKQNYPSIFWKAHKKSTPDNCYQCFIQGVPQRVWIGYKSRGGYNEHGLGAELYNKMLRFLGRPPKIAQMTGYLDPDSSHLRTQIEEFFVEKLKADGFDLIVTPTLVCVTRGVQDTIRRHLKSKGALLLRPLNPCASRKYLDDCQAGIKKDPNFDIKDLKTTSHLSKGAIWVVYPNEETLKGFTISAAIFGRENLKTGECQNLKNNLLSFDKQDLIDPIEFYKKVRKEIVYSDRII